MLGIYSDFYRYAYRFCGGFQDVFGFNVSGASHLDELSKLLKPVMLRRLKEEVLSDLPEVTYDKVYLEPTSKLLSLSRQEKAEQDKQIGETSSLRRMLGVLKAEAAIDHLEDLLETKSKIVVFTWHHEVVDTLMDHFKNRAVAYTGRQDAKKKEEAKDDFLKRDEVKLFVGNIDAAGIGVDGLQEVCDVCVFVELSHVPGIIKQAVDRLRRIGQARPVLAQFLVVEDSMDEDFVNSLTTKSKNINVILQERREVNFIGVKCSVCGSPKEMKEIRRAAGLPVCAKCEKLMESIL
jgi:SWI/SNF-related matrix-associated actin-dependent regulator 1 of chromatin subfamily A